MKSQVPLQGPMSSGFIWVFLTGLLVLAPLFIFFFKLIYKSIKNSKKNKAQAVPVQVSNLNNLERLKSRFLVELRDLELDIEKEIISSREGYQNLSLLLRRFVNEYTGVDVMTRTLAEIKAMNMNGLASLISEYYKPEFSVDTKGDVMSAIEKTREVIKSWN